jgi:hypothetical protein
MRCTVPPAFRDHVCLRERGAALRQDELDTGAEIVAVV